MFRPSSPRAQAASTNKSIRIAACFADIPNCNPSLEIPNSQSVLDRPRLKWNSAFHAGVVPETADAGPRHGETWAGPISAKDGGAFGSSRFRGLPSAALGGGRQALGRDLWRLVRLVRHHLLVGTMVAGMPDMMAAHPG